jgi:DNA-binding beta-propeller fold protein YncE
MRAFWDLVAGEGQQGYGDGSFTESLFHNPLGLALNGDGTRLYVADQGNNRIRMVLLGLDNSVTTLAGTGEKADHDGALGSSGFNGPRLLAWLPSNQLAIYENDGACLRLVDLQQNQVKTIFRDGSPELAGLSLAGCQNMVYDPSTNVLFLSQPAQKVLWRVDLSGQKETITCWKPPFPLSSPDCLCLYRGHLYATDRDTSKVFQVDFLADNSVTGACLVSFFAQGTKIKALTASGDSLYALQDDPKPFVCLNSGRVVDPPMVWDNPIQWAQTGDRLVTPQDWYTPTNDLCLIPADRLHPGRFFLAVGGRNEVVSFRDMGYQSTPVENSDCSAGLKPYGHPQAKAPGVFRILIVSAPQLNEPYPTGSAVGPSPGPLAPVSQATPLSQPSPTPTPIAPAGFSCAGYFPLFSLAMRAELALNTRGALEDDPRSYEVLSLDPSLLDPSQLPALASKYGVDLVLALESASDNPQPSVEWLDRAASALQTAGTTGTRLAVCYLPGTGAVAENTVEKDGNFWIMACMNKGLPLLDLTQSWTALRCTYFPVAQSGSGAGLSIKGLSLLGWLLAHQLVSLDFWEETGSAADIPSPGPIRQFQDLAAGEGARGYRDGSFDYSLWDGPAGLAVNADGSLLFVADRNNRRIRMVDLLKDNSVETLAGNGEAEEKDGPFAQASFIDPSLVAAVPRGLVVYDAKSGHLRFLDLQSKSVSIWDIREKGRPLAEGRLAGVFNMCYSPAKHCLYLTQPAQGRLERISLDGRELKVEMENDPRVAHPGALCLFGGALCLADTQSPSVYKVGTIGNAGVSLAAVGQCDHARALCSSQDRLYAISGSPARWIRVSPPRSDLSLSPWNASFQSVAFDFSLFEGTMSEDGPVPGLVSDPREEKRLFLASPGFNQILSLRDYDLSDYLPRDNSTPDGFSDFNYPRAKPPGTFRLMILGDSHVFRNDNGTNHLENLAKRLELFLNTEAAIDGIPTRFQVLNFAIPNGDDNPPYYYPAFQAPVLAQKYDVDEMLLCLNSETNRSNLAPFTQRPLDSQDVPVWAKDGEYLLKPVRERIPRGKAGDLFRRHLTVSGANASLDLDYQKLVDDPQDREDLAYLFSRPILKLRKEADSMRTKEGRRVPLRICFFPAGSSGLQSEVEPYRGLWKTAAEQAGVSFADLSGPFLALRPDYFPVAENFGTFHPTADGYLLKALVLADQLIREKWIPFQTSAEEKGGNPGHLLQPEAKNK